MDVLAIEKKREQARIRQAHYYERKKEEIKQKRRDAYNEEKEIKNEGQTEEKHANGRPINAVETENPNKRYLNHIEKADLMEHTKKAYIGNIKRLIGAVGNDDILTLIRTRKIRERIDATNYSNNTKYGMIMTALTALNGMKIKLPKKIFNELKAYMDLLTREINNERTVKQATETVIKFKDYIKKVKDAYGDASKMFIIANLYDEITVRDDFQLQIVDKAPKKPTHNYLILNKQNCRVLITKYKTANKYGNVSVLCSKKLSELLKKYIYENNLQIGDYLLGDGELSDYINYNNKNIGVNGAVSMFRQMKITELSNDPKITNEDMIELAGKMKHSPLIQLTYLRNLKLDNEPA